MSQQMRGRMPQDVEPVGIFVGHDADLRVAVNAIRGVNELAVDPARERRLAQAPTNASRQVVDRDRLIELALTAIRQGHDRHSFSAKMWLAGVGTNHRPPPCQGGALPLSYAPTGA